MGGDLYYLVQILNLFYFSKKIITDEKNLIEASDFLNVDGDDDCKSLTQCFCWGIKRCESK